MANCSAGQVLYSTISIYTMTLSMKFTKVSSQSHDWDQQVQGKDKILLSGHLLKELQLLEFKKKKKKLNERPMSRLRVALEHRPKT